MHVRRLFSINTVNATQEPAGFSEQAAVVHVPVLTVEHTDSDPGYEEGLVLMEDSNRVAENEIIPSSSTGIGKL